jgi:hypothetical protein
MVPVLAILIAGCSLIGHSVAAERRPTVVGLIADRQVTSSSDLTIRLADGSSVTLPAAAERLMAASTAAPGELLLADPTATVPWFVSLAPQNECYIFRTPYAELRTDRLVAEDGLVVPLAATFDPGPGGADGRFDGPPGTSVCIDEKGEAIRIS